jgi:transcriptional regulator GlxA family with amidase domain
MINSVFLCIWPGDVNSGQIYFDNLSFGESIRKLRIKKATELIKVSSYSLTEIAYLTGFSDQSHFTRIFKQHTAKSSSSYKIELAKSKANTKG